jgi:4-alpha-glucanotransferase
VKTADLRELARLYSIQITYEDAAGKKRTASTESLAAAIEARLPKRMKLDKALAARRVELEQRVIEPVTVVWGKAKPLIELRNVDRADYELTLESGERTEGRLTIRANHTAVLDQRLPFGYHTLRINRNYETALFVAPAKTPASHKKTWGVFAPLYAMHSDNTWGIGDLGDMRACQQWVAKLGGSVVATLPMNAIYGDEDPSPYAPVSRLFWNELYLDVRRLPEYRGEPLEPLPSTGTIDYPRITKARREFLCALSQRFFEHPAPDFGEFVARANDYAMFRSRMESTLGSWRDWSEDDEFGFDSMRYHFYVQYRMEQQMREVEALYLDFPLGVHGNGYDAWRFQDHFAAGASVGSPPDLVFTKGQNWGFPPLDPDAIRERHHSYFRDCIRHQFAYASILRIDHVMGLHRLFWIPAGAEPKDGVYVRYPEDELYAILMIESQRSNSIILGEDLGTVPQYVPKTMEKHGVRRMVVVQYEMKADRKQPLGRPSSNSIASINTHDMPTFAGFWEGLDFRDRAALRRFLKARRLLQRSESDSIAVLEALLRFLGSSDAEIVLVNLEDLWLEREPQNRPGVPERSWRHRMTRSFEETQNDATVIRLLRAVDETRRKANGRKK